MESKPLANYSYILLLVSHTEIISERPEERAISFPSHHPIMVSFQAASRAKWVWSCVSLDHNPCHEEEQGQKPCSFSKPLQAAYDKKSISTSCHKAQPQKIVYITSSRSMKLENFLVCWDRFILKTGTSSFSRSKKHVVLWSKLTFRKGRSDIYSF